MDSRVALKFDGSASASVDAYLEYKRIVGDDDNGKLFTQEAYENYKKEVLPARAANRLYTSWTNSKGMDCKLIGPETKCFCQHRYKQHKTDFEKIPESRPILLPCKVQKCPCASYDYIPLNGTQSIRCHCKHFALDHTYNNKRQCTKSGCKCSIFKTSFNCACGETVPTHETLVETRQERFDRGHPVARNEPLYAAMGGITGFSSLMDGYMRLDDSGIGALSLEELSAPTTSNSHPFERALCPQGVQKIPHQKKRALDISSKQRTLNSHKT